MFKKLLPILFLFTGFQANAVLIGNLTYDGTYISGDGRTYVGLNTIASWDYATTLAATQVGGAYEGFRIANTADADFFIGSLFGTNANACSTIDGTANTLWCGTITGWADGVFGANITGGSDRFWFITGDPVHEVGEVMMTDNGPVYQQELRGDITTSDQFVYAHNSITWMLVKDTVAAPAPPIVALLGLGIFGIGFARRRRQS
jgi:hypothetical protein